MVYGNIRGVPWSWLNVEKWRLHTFSNYPERSPTSVSLLAKEGFAYTGTGIDSDDSVICYFCNGLKRDWHGEDIVRDIHRGISPTCPMVTGARCNNVPMTVCMSGSRQINASEVDELQQPYFDIDEPAPSFGIEQCCFQVQSACRNIARDRPRGPRQFASVSVMSLFPPEYSISGATQRQSSTSLGLEIPLQETDRCASSAMVTSNDPGFFFSARNEDRQAATGTAPTDTSSLSVSQSFPNFTGASHPSIPASIQRAPVNQYSIQAPSVSGHQGNTTARPREPTYYQLEKNTQRPKFVKYEAYQERLVSFGAWPSYHHVKKEDLADAGFFYTGHGDVVTCFHCNGSLRQWQRDDNALEEHAFWFPGCVYIGQKAGQEFIDTVQTRFRQRHVPRTLEMNGNLTSGNVQAHLEHDPAVVAVQEIGREMGLEVDDATEVASQIIERGGILSADRLVHTMLQRRSPEQVTRYLNGDEHEGALERKIRSNNDMRRLLLCKICGVGEVAIIFSPCQHMVCCETCSPADDRCPVCGENIEDKKKGTVRGSL